MKFISPKVDFAFKMIFGSDKSEAILISFLNAIIYKGEKTIQSLKIINPYNPGKIDSFKETYLDVKATLADGSIVVIEMQVGRMAGFSKRIMYNLTKAYANQLTVAERYLSLRPAIAVTIVDFVLFKDKAEVISQFVFKEKTKDFEYPDEELQLFFVELPKFKKDLAELSTLSDKWIYFLKEAAKLDEIPTILGEVEEIEEALSIANQTSMTFEELDLVDRRSILLQDEEGRIIYAREQGREQGRQQGIEEGRQQGKQQGIEEGKQQGKEEGRFEATLALVLRQLKKRFGEIPEAQGSQVENLAISDLEGLAEDLFEFKSLEDLSRWLQGRS
ncbi:MAG: Rpn family recombination-promoting nuclease/putative transposase [Oscillatoria sp. SIO1A7]|nr:Rpn family recombination-promoting nuclease/putative transposase [Oscillatoria sp. SIO1A7]